MIREKKAATDTTTSHTAQARDVGRKVYLKEEQTQLIIFWMHVQCVRTYLQVCMHTDLIRKKEKTRSSARLHLLQGA